MKGLGRPGRKVNESAVRMENIPSTMVLHKNIYGADTRFFKNVRIIGKNPMEKWLGVIRIGTYQAASEDSRWEYKPVPDLCPDVVTDSDSSDDESRDEGSKYQENLDYK